MFDLVDSARSVRFLVFMTLEFCRSVSFLLCVCDSGVCSQCKVSGVSVSKVWSECEFSGV